MRISISTWLCTLLARKGTDSSRNGHLYRSSQNRVLGVGSSPLCNMNPVRACDCWALNCYLSALLLLELHLDSHYRLTIWSIDWSRLTPIDELRLIANLV